MEDKEYRIAIILLICTLIFVLSFYEFFLIPKYVKLKDRECLGKFIELNRIWIDVFKGKINMTEDKLNRIEVLTDGIEESLK